MYKKREKHSYYRSAFVIFLSLVMIFTGVTVLANYAEASSGTGGDDIVTEEGTINEDKDVYRVLIISPFTEWDSRSEVNGK